MEDHASFRQALAFMFEREPEFKVIEQASTLAEARRLSGEALLSSGEIIEMLRLVGRERQEESPRIPPR